MNNMETKTTNNNNENKTESPQNEINDLLKGYKQKMTVEEKEEPEKPKKKIGRPKKKKEEPEIGETQLISGALFLLLIDLAIPTLMAFVNNKFSDDKIKAKQLKMTKDQREELAPIADEAVKQLMLYASPLTIFIISIVGIYGLNFMMLKSND